MTIRHSLLSRGSRVQIAAGALQFASVSAYVRHLIHREAQGNVVLIVTTVTLALLASSAQAQEHHRLRLPVLLMAAAGSVDIASTMHNAHYNAVHAPGAQTENNPLIAWMEPKIGTGRMLTIAAVAEVGILVTACHFLCEHHPTLMKTAFLVGAGAHGTAATWNLLSPDPQPQNAAIPNARNIRRSM